MFLPLLCSHPDPVRVGSIAPCSCSVQLTFVRPFWSRSFGFARSLRAVATCTRPYYAPVPALFVLPSSVQALFDRFDRPDPFLIPVERFDPFAYQAEFFRGDAGELPGAVAPDDDPLLGLRPERRRGLFGQAARWTGLG